MHTSGDAKSLSSPGSSSGYCSGTEDDQGPFTVGLQSSTTNDSSSDDIGSTLFGYGRPFFDRLNDVELSEDINCSDILNDQPLDDSTDDWNFADQSAWSSSLFGYDTDRMFGLLSNSNNAADFEDSDLLGSMLTESDSNTEPFSDDFIILSASTFNALVVATAGVDFDQPKFLDDGPAMQRDQMSCSLLSNNCVELEGPSKLNQSVDMEQTYLQRIDSAETMNDEQVDMNQLIFADFDEFNDQRCQVKVAESSMTLSQINESDNFLHRDEDPASRDSSINMLVDERTRTKNPERHSSFSSVTADPSLVTDETASAGLLQQKPTARHFSCSSLIDSKTCNPQKQGIRNGRYLSTGTSTGRPITSRPKQKSRSTEIFHPSKIDNLKRTNSAPVFVRHQPSLLASIVPVKKNLAPGLEDHRYSNRSKEDCKPRSRPVEGRSQPSSVLETVLRSNVRIDPNRGSDVILMQPPKFAAQGKVSQNPDTPSQESQTVPGSGLLHRLLTGPADEVHMQVVESDTDKPRADSKTLVVRSKSLEQTSRRKEKDCVLGCEFLFEDNIAGLCHLEADSSIEDWMSTGPADEMMGLDCEQGDDESWLQHCFQDLL